MAVNWASGEVVGTLTYLLPGFVAAGIFYSLTSHPKPNAFDRTVLALIFTVIGQTITEFILLPTASAVAGAQTFKGWEPALSVLVAILLGLGASIFSNTDIVHWILRRLRFTRETSYPTEWYSTFARYGDRCFLVLHLQGERRLFGFAEEWPSNPKDGHFRIADAEWLIGEDKRVPATGVDAILIPATEVTMMEFVPIATEERQEEAM